MFYKVPNTLLCYVNRGLAISDGKKYCRYVVNDSHAVLKYFPNKRNLIYQFI